MEVEGRFYLKWMFRQICSEDKIETGLVQIVCEKKSLALVSSNFGAG
jgi:hypothetical protein